MTEVTPQSPAAGAQAAPPALSPEEEVAELRAQVAALEAELADTHRRANAAIAAAQEQVYWLDRWHVDLNELMRRRSAAQVRAVLRAVRGMARRLRRFTRALR
ncbi:MAG: hypothetical protein QOF77_1709 [Solirubrobacteraceae bacterium]|nr:hypothetical protein [Solirubrobacteraceae bacterium]